MSPHDLHSLRFDVDRGSLCLFGVAGHRDEDAEQESDADYEAMTKEELVAICKEKGIATKSRDTKEELVAKLTEGK